MNATCSQRRLAGLWLLMALAVSAIPVLGDTLRLKSGAVVEGNITREDATQITIVTEHAGGTIFRPETFLKSDIAEITRLTAEERRQHEMLQAFGKIQGYRLIPDTSLPLARYDDVIENHLRPFLVKYPDSPYADAVAEKLTKWETERARVAAASAPAASHPTPPLQTNAAAARTAAVPPGKRPAASSKPSVNPVKPSDAPAESSNAPPKPSEKPAQLELAPAPLDWRFEIRVGALVVAFCLHVLGLLWVNRTAQNIGAAPRPWNTVALLLPVVGVAAFTVMAYIKRRGFWTPRLKPPDPVSLSVESSSHFPVEKEVSALAVLDAAGDPVAVRTGGKSKPVFNAVRAVLAHAIDNGASDIHIEPTDNDVLMRLRVDGAFQPKQLLGRDMGTKVVASLKTFANVDVADRRKSQDGRFQVNYGGRIVDFRLATSNSIYGENVVMRLLDRSTGIKSLEALGMPERSLEEFQAALKVPGGMILVAGPTGSGKTTTVYAALSRFDPAARKIVTVEDPVEYELPGATQIPVNVKAGVSYEEGLKSVMRQDPDIILVGEMRSKEATEIAIRAALTGHLVFSTVHAPSALGTILRLRDMGIEPYLISSAVIAVVSQRLVRRLCPDCKQPAAPDLAMQAALNVPAGSAQSICRPVGCERCAGTGFRGRIGVFEILSLDPEAKRLIVAGASEDELFQHARRLGMRTMREDVHAKILEGITTLQEAALSMKA